MENKRWWLDHKYVALLTVLFFIVGYSVLFMTGASSIRHLLDNLVAGYLVAWGLYGLLSNVPRAEVGKRFVLTTITIGVFWAIAEGTAWVRLIDYRLVFGTFDTHHVLGSAGRRFDSELLWRHEPYFSFEADYQGNLGRALCMPPDRSQRVRVRYDRNGFRNSEDLTSADIVVIGDSYIEAPMLDDKVLATTLLSRLQGRTVANLGNSGYGPQQELAVLKRFALPLHPDVVIWAFFEGNDFSNTEEYDTNVLMLAEENPYWQDFWFRSLSRNLFALYFRSNKGCTPSTRVQQYRGRFNDNEHRATPVLFAPTELVSPSNDQLHRVADYMLEASRLCRERGIGFMVVFVPEKYRVYHDLANVELGTDELRGRRVNDLPQRLRRVLVARAPNIHYVDLTPALKAESRRGIATYLPDDTHWSAAGHRVAAEAIHRALSTPTLARRL